MERAELEALDRESLVVKAQEAGIRRARILTRPELIDELLRLDPRTDEAQLRKSRGFFGVARDLLARVVERGLHLPDAADRIRQVGEMLPTPARVEPQVVPTVTLAEIYAAQGHPARAIETLERVLEREPDHAPARALLARLTDEDYVPPPPPLPPEPEVEEVPAAAAEEEEEEEAVDEALEDAQTNEIHAALSGRDGGEDAETIAMAGEDLHRDDAETVALQGSMSFGPTEIVDVAVPPDASRSDAPPPFAPSESASVTRVLSPECVVVPTTSGSAFVWWRAGMKREGMPFVVRVLVVEPSWDGPRTHVQDIEVDPLRGELTLEDLPARAVVRAAIGWGAGEAFSPVAHAPLLEAAPRAASGPSGLLRWTLGGMRPVELDDPASRPIADALRRARALARG